MKNLEQLEQEAKQAREVAIATTDNPFELMSTKIDSIILASVAMVTYQFALGMQEVSGDGSGESLPEVSQEERDSDGWIEWGGGSCPVSENEIVDLKFGSGYVRYGTDTKYKWEGTGARDCDIVAYRVAKAYPCKLSKVE